MKERMAAKRLIDISMTLALIHLLLLLVPTTGAARYLSGEATETEPGIIAAVGGIVSPVPTQAPAGWNEIPKKLWEKSLGSIIISSPAPPYWCGFIDGNYRKFFS